MKIRLSKAAVRQYIRILQELENADLSSNSVELDVTIFSSLSNQSQQLKEMLYADYGDESPNLEISVNTKNTQALNIKVARKKLRAKLLKAESLTICDPYLFAKPSKESLDVYLDNFLSVLPLKTLRFLVIVHDREKGNPQLIREFKKRIPDTIKISIRTNSTIHDRVWIVDKNTAFVVGTSFGGIGRRLSFLCRFTV